MKQLRKSLLAAAVTGAIALPGLSSAATLYFAGAKQITYARDLIVNNDTTIETQDNLRLRAETPDQTRITTVTPGSDLTVKVTLTNGARFDSTTDPIVLVTGFTEGAQTGGLGNVINYQSGTANYSGNGQELTFVYKATNAGNLATSVPDGLRYVIEINSARVKNLIQSLGTAGGEVDAEITVQNASGQQILAARQTIAKSIWGLRVVQQNNGLYFPDTLKRIDVGATPRKTLFSPFGGVGASTPTAGPGRFYFNAGGFDLDIAVASHTSGGGNSYVNDYNAVAANPVYNVVGTADITIRVNGTNLNAFSGRAWLDSSSICNTTVANQRANLSISSANPGVAQVTVSANHALFKNVSDPFPGPSRVYVCLAAGAGTTASPAREMLPQSLSGIVSVDYDLPTQRVNPPDMPFTLLPLQLNGTTLTFQNVNPAGNSTAVSFLRLTNNNGQICPVTIDAKDDLGRLSGEVQLTLQPHASEQVNIDALESGNDPRFTNTNAGFRDGQGKWYVRVTAECNSFVGSALNRNSTTGVVTDLTSEKGVPSFWLTPTTPVP